DSERQTHGFYCGNHDFLLDFYCGNHDFLLDFYCGNHDFSPAEGNISWTAEEDEQLRELVQKMRIGNFIPYTQSNDIIWNQVLDPSLKRGSWTKQEDRVRNMELVRF
uniref:Myb-like domain-containing protein n=1 Tax=Poecilia latipinna TaxID=48699 RepID=A0A3B3UHN6_9TELE